MQQIGHAVWLDGLVLLVAGLMILDLAWNCGRGHWIELLMVWNSRQKIKSLWNEADYKLSTNEYIEDT